MVRASRAAPRRRWRALRVARGFTGRDVIVKFEGCYHGHADFLLVKAGSGAATFGVPDSAGVPARDRGEHADARRSTTSPRCARSSRRAARRSPPSSSSRSSATWASSRRRPGFLEAIVDVCAKARRGLDLRRGDDRLPRRARRHAGARGLAPDMTCLGKIVGGGMPLAAYGGKRAIMEKVAPLGPVYQAGHAEREPGRRERGPRHARAPRRRALRAPRGARRAPRSGPRARDRDGAASRRACSASAR